MQIDLEAENKEITKRYRQMLKSTYQDLTKEDLVMIRKAFNLAKDGHKDQRRKTGEPYIYHPIAVAQIVANEIGLGAVSIAAALLHDVVEDTDYTNQDIETHFGKTIAMIIEGLTKISIINNQDISIQSENYRKLLLTLSEDFRVILIKIADRLHNMRTLEAMKPEKQLKIASETIYIYAPIAHRMGMYNIKTELEDLSLKYTEPTIYKDIETKLIESKEERDLYIKTFSAIVSKKLEEEGLEFSIKGRPKSVHSIHKKILKQGISFKEIYDKFAIRIIYRSDKKNEKFLAWKIFSLITDEFKPNPKRLRDWISSPRTTGYESLHATVMGPNGRWVEVQIRSERMDEMAEKGIAAHYKYKEGNANEDNQIENWIVQIREFLENQEDVSADELVNNFKNSLFHKEIFVFSPKGDLKVLPFNATALDFAYSVHTNIGDTCLGAKVNGKLVPLSYKLISGDQIEIITSANQQPKQSWLEYVVTSRAKSKIKNALNTEKRVVAEEGKVLLERKLRHLKIKLDAKEEILLLKFFKFSTTLELYHKVGEGIIDSKRIKEYAESKGMINSFLNRIRRKPKNIPVPETIDPNSKLDTLVFGKEEEKMDYSLAKCCTPIAGDNVFGFIRLNKGIIVHKNNCPNAVNMRANYNYRILQAKWIDKSNVFNTNITLKGIDKMGIVNDISNIITAALHINMKSFNMNTNDGLFEGNIKLEVKNKTQLENLIQKLKKVEGIKNIERTNN